MNSARRAETILVLDDEPAAARLLEYLMEASGYRVQVAMNVDEAIAAIQRTTPDLILADVEMPGTNGLDFTRSLRHDPRLAGLLVLMVTGRHMPADKLEGLAAGADDYIVKPFEPAELIARVYTLLRRARELRSQSPLTGLPGNQRIEEEIDERVESRRPFALLYADLDQFKSYNDYFGFSAGDRVIRTTGWMLQDVAAAIGGPEAFVGHVGGDDFVLVVPEAEAIATAETVIERFDREVRSLYPDADRARGWIETLDRQGAVARFPLLTISIGIASPASAGWSRPAIVKAATDMKAIAKRTPGSVWAGDQRSAASLGLEQRATA